MRPLRAVVSCCVVATVLAGGCRAPEQQPAPPVTVVVTREPQTQPVDPPTSPPASWPATLSRVAGGVVLVRATSCLDGAGYAGTGSVVADDLVLTAAHVVEDAASVLVHGVDGDVAGVVIGYDGEHDLALVRTASAVGGHVFELAPEPPGLGTPIAAIGYPLGDDLTINDGIVSSLQWSEGASPELVERLVVSAAINPGNSGGPVVTQDGVQVGVAVSVQVDPETGERRENRTFAVSSTRARALLAEYGASRTEVQVPSCPSPEDLGEVEPWEGNWDRNPLFVSNDSGDPRAQELLGVVARHGYAINQRDWSTAFGLLSPAAQARLGGVDVWSRGLTSTVWNELDALALGSDPSGPTLAVYLQTEQDPAQADGLACTDRWLTYHLTVADTAEGWLIDKVTEDSPPEGCAGE